jgi:DNA-binding transcriptional LysR family regulator
MPSRSTASSPPRCWRSRSSPCSRQATRTPATVRCRSPGLADTPFVYSPRHAGPRAFEKPLALCEEHGFRPRIAHEASHWLSILRLVGAGLGVSIAPACVRHIATADVSCVALREAPVVSELEFMHRVGEHRPMVHAFGQIATGADSAAAKRA